MPAVLQCLARRQWSTQEAPSPLFRGAAVGSDQGAGSRAQDHGDILSPEQGRDGACASGAVDQAHPFGVDDHGPRL